MIVLYKSRKPSEEDAKTVREILDDSAELVFEDDLNDEEKVEILAKTNIILGGRLSEEDLEIATNLKMQQTYATGINRHNLEFFKKKGIMFCNNHSHAFTIAEYGFALLNAASKELTVNDQLLRKGNWDYNKYRSVSLFDKTVVLLGFGEIAKTFKKLCEPFNMKFIAIKRTKDCDDPSVEVYLSEDKMEALKQADFIFNSLPLTKKTTDFLDTEAFEVMQPHTIIVNVGRAQTMNEEALYNALKEKKIKGAALDPWYKYPGNRWEGADESEVFYPSDFPYQELDNVIMSSHRAWVTDIPMFEYAKSLIHNINRFIRGETPLNIVDLDEGY